MSTNPSNITTGHRDLNATIEIRAGLQGGSEPWNQTATLAVDLDGFHDVDGIGRAGDEPGTLALADVCSALLDRFDRSELCGLLDRIVQLRAALNG